MLEYEARLISSKGEHSPWITVSIDIEYLDEEVELTEEEEEAIALNTVSSWPAVFSREIKAFPDFNEEAGFSAAEYLEHRNLHIRSISTLELRIKK